MIRILINISVLLSLAACAGNPKNDSSLVARQLGLQYTLASEGLPIEGKYKSTPLLTDINGDGFTDLAIHVRLADGPRVWLGNGEGVWTDSSDGLSYGTTSCGGGLALADVNNDGHLDLAIADHCQGVYIFLGDGKGGWEPVVEKMNPDISRDPELIFEDMNTFTGAEGLGVDDVNGDGFLDLVVSASDEGGFKVYLGDGSGITWKETDLDGLPDFYEQEEQDSEKAGWANKTILRDMNGDGVLDVVASYYAGPRVWLNDGKGQWTPYSKNLPTPVAGGIFRGIDAADFNEDGLMDIVVANHINGPEIFLQKSDGSWEWTPDMLPRCRGGAAMVKAGDLDKDGHVDVIVGGRLNRQNAQFQIFVLRGDGKGTWTEISGTGLPDDGLEVTWGAAITDINKDGWLDIAISTGGSEGSRMNKTPEEKAKELPRMQVWFNSADR